MRSAACAIPASRALRQQQKIHELPSEPTVGSELTHSLETMLVNDFPFVLLQFTVLCVQFIGIPLLLLFVVIDEFLSRADSRALGFRHRQRATR
jgi:hypothetical protein